MDWRPREPFHKALEQGMENSKEEEAWDKLGEELGMNPRMPV